MSTKTFKLVLIGKDKQILDIDYGVYVNDNCIRVFPADQFEIDKDWFYGYLIKSEEFYKFDNKNMSLTVDFWYLRPYIVLEDK